MTNKQKSIEESTQRALVAGVLLARLGAPLHESAAFKQGIIDEDGNVIKLPSTDEERAALTPIDYYCLKIRKFLGESKVELLNTSLLLDSLSKAANLVTEDFDPKKYEQEIALKNKLFNLIEDYKIIALEAYNSGIPLENVENFLFEGLINAQNEY